MIVFVLHGEGIIFGAAAHLIFGVAAAFALVCGLLRAESRVIARLLAAYLPPTLLVGALLRDGGWTQTAAALLTLPWYVVVPCYGLDDSCPVSRTVLLVCAALNAAALVHLANRLAKRRGDV